MLCMCNKFRMFGYPCFTNYNLKLMSKVITVFREMNSVDRRRELNRLAAQKLRNRQKEKAVTVKQV